MALDERADAVTTVDRDEAETPVSRRGPSRKAPVEEPTVEPTETDDGSAQGTEKGSPQGNGVSRDESAGDDAADGGESPLAPVSELPNRASGNGAATAEKPSGRTARKRTARQRSLLVAESAAVAAEPEPETTGVETPVDPLLAAAPTEAAADEGSGSTDASADADAQATAPSPILPASTTAAAAAAAALYAPAPSRTMPLPGPMPLPVLSPPDNGQAATEVIPAPPVVVVPPPPRPRRRARPRVRKVTRIVRSVDAWSVFKVAIVFFVAMGVVLMTAGVLLWNLAQSTGTLDNVEGFFREAFNYDTFKLESEPLFRAGLTLTALFVVAATGLTVVMAVLFNLIADLTGGIRLTVLEREVVARDDQRSRGRRRRQFRAPRPAPAPSPPPDPTAALPDDMPRAPSVKAPSVKSPRPG